MGPRASYQQEPQAPQIRLSKGLDHDHSACAMPAARVPRSHAPTWQGRPNRGCLHAPGLPAVPARWPSGAGHGRWARAGAGCGLQTRRAGDHL